MPLHNTLEPSSRYLWTFLGLSLALANQEVVLMLLFLFLEGLIKEQLPLVGGGRCCPYFLFVVRLSVLLYK